MKVTQIRNATMVIHVGDNVILIDPMLAPKGAIPTLKYVTANRRRNPLVDLPVGTDQILKKVTHCFITHCQKGHFDHLDRAGTKWLRDNNIPVYCSEQDGDFLKKKGLDVHVLSTTTDNPFLGGKVSLVPCVHGVGVIGKFMAHGYGFYFQLPNEPSLYASGDTILTSDVRNFIQLNQPDWLVIPAGGARFDIGGDIIMGLEEAMEVAAISEGQVIANHLESLDHCPVTRRDLQARINLKKMGERFHIPVDGEAVSMEA